MFLTKVSRFGEDWYTARSEGGGGSTSVQVSRRKIEVVKALFSSLNTESGPEERYLAENAT